MLNFLSVLASSSYDEAQLAATGGMLVAEIIFYVIIYVVEAIALMKIFEKAGVTSWYAWIPFLNTYWITQIATGNGWLFLIMFIPCVGTLIWCILVAVKLAAAFGQGGGMIALLILIPIVGYYVLAFGGAQYQGPQ